MNFDEQRERALRLLEQAGIGRNTYAPPLIRILWRCGVPVGRWGVGMSIMFWSRQNIGTWGVLVGACCAGLCYGLFMAGYFVRQARKHGLPSWESLA
jgi:hypothetical protein